ncbi:hypothetical protein EVAR_15724_1 [Eumeta japonica]|uniref:Circadian clock-controlled protein n=1 Tax=Eumeta variegata TaxID=151549 RepID=A0A4C1U9Q3_EUMVA|nr:hypothetical protein EVAR_15724_1 [Eumeta japonica]
MKLLVVLLACALAAAATPLKLENIDFDMIQGERLRLYALRKFCYEFLTDLYNLVMTKRFLAIGHPGAGSLFLEQYHLLVPAGLLNLDVNVTNGLLEGLGDFVVHQSNFDRGEISFEVEMSVPLIKVKADNYKLVGDFFTMIPLYGDGIALFEVENFRARGKFYLKQSDDEKSILIDRIDEPSYSIGSIKSGLTGVIGGGNIDGIINSIVEEVIVGYANRFSGAIALVVSRGLVEVVNPFLDQLDSWRYIQIIL